MATNGISNGLTGLGQSNANPNPAALVNQDDFLKLLTAQLRHQDPLNPIENSDFTAQLAQFSTLSGVQQLNTSTQQMLQLQQISQGAALVGKTVTYGDSDARAVRGTVDAVHLQDGKLLLQIGGKSVSADQVWSILSSNAS